MSTTTSTAENEVNIINLVLDQFKDVTILGLLVSVIIGFLIASIEKDPQAKISAFIEPFIIFALLVFNAIISVIFELQHRRVRKSVQNMKNAKSVTIIKNGKESQVPASQIKVGDTILLSKGDRSPADIEITQVISNSIQYEVVDKSSNLTLADQKNGLIFSGAAITRGSLLGKVKCLPSSPDSHHISVHAKPSGQTFVSQLDSFSHRSSIIILVVCLIIYALNFSKIKEYGSFMKGALSLSRISLALIISSLPEHLSNHYKTAQSTAAKQMLQSNACCTEQTAIDTIGRITVLCGNLSSAFTSSVTKVQEFATVSDDIVDIFTVTGEGYSPVGVINQCGVEVTVADHKAFEKIALGTMLSSHLTLVKSSSGNKIVSDGAQAINSSLQAFAAKILPSNEKDEFLRIKNTWNSLNEINPLVIEKEFSRETKSAVFSCGSTKFTLGAYETVFRRCNSYLDDQTGEIKPLSQRVKAKLEYKFTDWSINYRILGLSYEEKGENVWVTGLALYNALHTDAMSSVEECRNSGVRVIIVSGENAQTVTGYATKMRLKNTSLVTRQQWLTMNLDERKNAVKSTDIYVEFTEDEKLDLIQILREQGEVVGMITGSVPDIMAMRAADIGISNDGASDCICGAASLLLKDDSVSALSSAVVLSRSSIKAAISCIRYILSCGITMISVSLFTAALNAPILLTGTSILLISLLTFPFTALIANNVDQCSTNSNLTKLVSANTRIRFIIVGLVGGIASISAALFVYLIDPLSSKHPVTFSHVINYSAAPRSVRNVLEDRAAPTMAALVVLLVHIVNAFDALTQTKIFNPKKNFFAIISFLGSLLTFIIITEVSFLSGLFGLTHLSIKRWLAAIALILPVFLVNIIFKFINKARK